MATDLKTNMRETIGEINKYDFRNEEHFIFRTRKGLNPQIVSEISEMKQEPGWMRDFRLEALRIFESKPMPRWGGHIGVDFQDIFYYLKPTDHQGRSWDDVPQEIKTTFDRLGIPEAEKKYLAGVKAQYESEVVYGLPARSFQAGRDLHRHGHRRPRIPDLVREYFQHDHSADDNKFAALNLAVWSGGSFIYVPPGSTSSIPCKPTSASTRPTWASSSGR